MSKLSSVLVALSACLALGRSARSQGIPSYLWPIVAENAPIIIEETLPGAINQRRINHLMRIDFDGDNNGANNDSNALAGYYPIATPTVYYSVAETADAYYIGYYFYHIRDFGTTAFGGSSGHQHDMEGIWEIVEKSPYYPYGYSRLMLSQAHGGMLPFYNPSFFSQPPAVGTNGAYPQGVIHLWPDPNAIMRPVVAIRRNDHGTYFAQRCDADPHTFPDDWDFGVGIYPNQQLACIHGDADGITYFPGPYPCAPGNGCVISDVPESAPNGSYYYGLTSLFDDPAFWPIRQTGDLMFGGGNTPAYIDGNQWGFLGFHGSDSDTEANPPWAWSGGVGGCTEVEAVEIIGCWYSYGADDTQDYDEGRVQWPQVAQGDFLTEPASAAKTFFPWQNWSTSIVFNPFLNGAGSRPPNLSAWIDGPTSFNDFNNTGTWTAEVSGGTPPYAYQWSGEFYGTSESISGTVTENAILYLDVWDATGVHVAVSTSLTYCPGGQISC
jgi:hypothetical protein